MNHNIRRDVRLLMALEAYVRNLENQRDNRHRRKANRRRPREDAASIAKMTNWQRNQYARAGYPMDRAESFAELMK